MVDGGGEGGPQGSLGISACIESDQCEYKALIISDRTYKMTENATNMVQQSEVKKTKRRMVDK